MCCSIYSTKVIKKKGLRDQINLFISLNYWNSSWVDATNDRLVHKACSLWLSCLWHAVCLISCCRLFHRGLWCHFWHRLTSPENAIRQIRGRVSACLSKPGSGWYGWLHTSPVQITFRPKLMQMCRSQVIPATLNCGAPPGPLAIRKQAASVGFETARWGWSLRGLIRLWPSRCLTRAELHLLVCQDFDELIAWRNPRRVRSDPVPPSPCLSKRGDSWTLTHELLLLTVQMKVSRLPVSNLSLQCLRSVTKCKTFWKALLKKRLLEENETYF